MLTETQSRTATRILRTFIRFLALIIGMGTAFSSFAKEVERPPLMSERFYASSVERTPADDRVWMKILIDMQIPGFQPRESAKIDDCNFNNALATLRSLRETSSNPLYLKIWAMNQDKVFTACDGSQIEDNPPVLPKKDGLPLRAKSDFLYQRASWHFYRNEYSAALALYEQVEKIRNAPMRPQAAYMVIRCLVYTDQADAAYDKILKVLSEPGLREVHEIASNYRFVLMSNTNYLHNHLSPELAKRHMLWLLSLIQIDPEKTKNPKQAIADYKDAITQLDVYFPIYARKSHKIDWWLTEATPTSARMQAVMGYAKTIALVDWMQAKWTYNVFNDDWLWSLHSYENPYWDQNGHVVAHELDQWKKYGDGGWLQLAISRVHPSDPLASVLLIKAETYLSRPWQSETFEYKEWLRDLWTHSIRVSLGQGKVKQALALITNHPEFSTLFDGSDVFTLNNNYYRFNIIFTKYAGVLQNTLRWLTYTGQFAQAREFLNIFQKQDKESFTRWRTLLAQNEEETLVSGLEKSQFQLYKVGASKDIWQEMLNTVSSSYLLHLSLDNRISVSDRALISRTLLTRSILRNVSPAEIDNAAAIAAKQNPSLREDILIAISGHEKIKYIEFLLKQPRFRPAVFLEYAREARPNEEEPDQKSIDKIDHNDNNWWCRFDENVLSERIFNAAKIIPAWSPIFSVEGIEGEFAPYLKKQRALLKAHPYHDLVDHQEIDSLKKIPSGPEYLSTYVNQWEHETPTTQVVEDRGRRAANLHRAFVPPATVASTMVPTPFILGIRSTCYMTGITTLRGQRQHHIGSIHHTYTDKNPCKYPFVGATNVARKSLMTRDISAYRQVVVESFIATDSSGERGLIHIRPIQRQAFSRTLKVQCSKRLADSAIFPVGTQFLLLAKLTDRLGGTPFLYAYHGDPEIVVTPAQAQVFISEFKRGRI